MGELPVRRTVSGLLIGAAIAGAGISVFSWGPAQSGPFAGFAPPTCEAGADCSAETFSSSATSGSGFTCNAELAECVDIGPGTCNEIGTNPSGDIILGGTDCNPTIRWGDSSVISGSSWMNINGAINCESGCQIRDSGNGTLPINTTGGVVFNSTTPIVGFLLVPVTIDLGVVTGACDDVTATVAGVETNDAVFVTPNFNLNAADINIGQARVTNAGTDEVTFRVCDIGGGGENPDSGSFLFWVVRKA